MDSIPVGSLDKDKLKQSIELFLEAIGEDKNREGLLETPQRVADMWEEILEDRNIEIKTFTNPDYNEMICKTGINFFSFCEHHLAVFYGQVSERNIYFI